MHIEWCRRLETAGLNMTNLKYSNPFLDIFSHNVLLQLQEFYPFKHAFSFHLPWLILAECIEASFKS